MKVISNPRAATPQARVPAPKHPPVQEHDLPVLAMEENPPVRPDWESLIEDGIQPALLIGGERRWSGRR